MDHSFHHCLLLAQTVFQKQVVLEAAEAGLLPGQSKILDYLLSHDGCEQKALGEAFHLEAATVTGILRIPVCLFDRKGKKDGCRNGTSYYEIL